MDSQSSSSTTAIHMDPQGTYTSTHPLASETFPLFPSFPPEIRSQIWIHALYPQTVIFEVVQTPFSSNKAFMKRKTKVHPILHVSQESRGEAMRVYFEKGNRPIAEKSTSTSTAGNEGFGLDSGDIWDVWRYFRFGVDICELRNDSRVPWMFLVMALGQESWGLERVMGRKTIA